MQLDLIDPPLRALAASWLRVAAAAAAAAAAFAVDGSALVDAHCAVQAIAPQPRCGRLPTLTAPCQPSRHSYAAAAC